MSRFTTTRFGRGRRRRGLTAVEFAITAPILFLLVFAALEYARMSMLWNTAVNAAYEGARRAVVPGATADDAEAEVDKLMNVVGAKVYTVTVTPSNIQPDTEEVTVAISVPIDQNSWIYANFFAGKRSETSCTLQRDFVETTTTP